MSPAGPCRTLLLCALSVAGSVALEGAAPPGRPIQFGAPDNSGTGTNFNSLATKSDGLNPYANAPHEPAPRLSNRGSMEGVMVPLRNQQTKPDKQSNRTRDLLEQRMNWAVMNNKELLNPEEEETILKLRGGTGDEKEQEEEALRLTPEEKMFLGLYEDKKDSRKDGSQTRDDRKKEGRDKDDSLSDTMREREESLREFLGTGAEARQPSEFEANLFGSSGQNRVRSQGADLFHLGQVPLPEQGPEQKARMEKFRQILGLPAASDPMQEMLKPRSAPTFSGIQQEAFSSPPALNNSPMTAPRESPSFGLVPSFAPVRAANEPSILPSLTPTLPQNFNNNTPRPVPAAPSFTAPKRAF